MLKLLGDCFVRHSHDKIFEAKQIEFHENLVENVAEQEKSHDSIENHDPHQALLASWNGGVWFFHEVSTGA